MMYIILAGLFVTIGIPLLILILAIAIAYRTIQYDNDEDDF